LPPGSIKTNSESEKFDLVSETHPILAEIKICGGDYQGKMRNLIKADIVKLTNAQRGPAKYVKYMILLIDTRTLETSLGKWLNDFHASEEMEEVLGKNFKARIWKMEETKPRIGEGCRV
jgi:hypothetical protein